MTTTLLIVTGVLALGWALYTVLVWGDAAKYGDWNATDARDRWGWG